MTVRSGGFSLIEALIALLIAALALMAVYELQQQLIQGQRRAQHLLQIDALKRDAMVLTADINPEEQPSGVLGLAGGRILRWNAVQRTGPALNTGSPAAGRRFGLRLYRMEVQILDRSGQPLGVVGFDRVGWRRLANPVGAGPAAQPALPAPPASGRPTSYSVRSAQ